MTLEVIWADERRWYEVEIEYAEHPHESYLFLSDISDLLQQEACRFDTALEAAVSTFEQILAHSRSLSREKQVGIYGELMFLQHCIQEASAASAITAWKGFAENEHDFVFPDGSFEIKTTTSEARRHRISSLDQLSPVPGSPLWLVSIQVTAATPATGRTLADVVDETRQMAGHHPELDKSLARAGWRERDRATYRNPYRLRSTPAAYKIDDQFPSITRAALVRASARPELIINASYVIDLTALTPGEPPSPAGRFIEE
ncbi:PD-(D/E)XK motif protein [Mycolicibacterium sp. 050232]|uniref:PD-(D/E)XK motif protein n=1 Tax=Mycolicibacterium sp. 050232 TaxID=3113982 RepID=UPI002E2BD8CE|nr:PD-(D/E)XK motif protein [Mycolicibacterium sp. 050232]MED5812901.1 PD-(D/E)XK motif protein [Mycolicibacterium sp. 050232]